MLCADQRHANGSSGGEYVQYSTRYSHIPKLPPNQPLIGDVRSRPVNLFVCRAAQPSILSAIPISERPSIRVTYPQQATDRMPNQPSTMDTVRSTAASATQTVVGTVDSSQNQGSNSTNSSSNTGPQDSSSHKPYKQQLDEAAYTYTLPGEDTKKETLVEKGTCLHYAKLPR